MKPILQTIVKVLLLTIAIGSLLAFGVLGVGRSGESSFDGAYIYAAGRAWLSGANPYDHAQLLQSVKGLPGIPTNDSYFLRDFFAYPPQVAVFSIPLGLLDYPVAKKVWLLLNLGAIAATVFLALNTLDRAEDYRVGSWGKCLIAALIIGNPFTTHVVWMGQSSFIAFSLTYAAWVFSRQRRWVWAGIFLGLASFKPQLCLLVFLWFGLQRYWKPLILALGTVLIVSQYPIAVQGSVGLIQAWWGGLQQYKNSSFNAVDVYNSHVVGLESLFHALGLPVVNTSFLGLALVLVLWILRDRLNVEDILGILMAITVTFIYAHDYDYVCLIPAFVSLLIYSHAPKHPNSSVAVGGLTRLKLALSSLLLAGLLCFPQRLIRVFAIPALSQWRTAVIFVLLLLVIHRSFRSKQETQFQQVLF